MAEIVKVVTSSEIRKITNHGDTTEAGPVKEVVTVRSIRGEGLDVSVLRDFAAAVRAAGLSGRALVTAERAQDGRLLQLKAQETRDVPVSGSGDEVAPVEDDPAGGAE